MTDISGPERDHNSYAVAPPRTKALFRPLRALALSYSGTTHLEGDSAAWPPPAPAGRCGCAHGADRDDTRRVTVQATAAGRGCRAPACVPAWSVAAMPAME